MTPAAPNRRVIFTADDFGLHPAVNAAVEQGYRRGVLGCASLMVAAPGASDALCVARACPGLRVGLHLVLADGQPVLAPTRIPDLVGGDGRFRPGMARAGARFFFLPGPRRQLAAEIRAQFEAFKATGLALDHVNAHKHFHLHPTISRLMLAIGREYGMQAARLPREPRRAGPGAMLAARAGRAFLAPWLALLERRLRAAGIVHNDAIFGLAATGAMREAVLLAILRDLPPGVSEIYLHPANRACIAASMAGYDHPGELAALTSPRVRAALTGGDIGFTDFSELAAERNRACRR